VIPCAVEYSIDRTPSTRQTAYRLIAEGIRDEILTRKLKPGTRLPTTKELAATWKSNVFTTHKALVALVKEGWVERFRGGGTYVANPKNRFFCAGIYHGTDICFNRHPPFVRSVHESLLEQFGRKKKEVQIFIDPRPAKEQEKILPALADAILKRRIQCVVAPTVNPFNLPALSKLALPTAFLATSSSFHRINFSFEEFLRESVRQLAAQGCRSIGLICPIHAPMKKDDFYAKFYPCFERAIRDEGLVTRREWILAPKHPLGKFEEYGYENFHKLWKLQEKPEGLIVVPDTVAQGAIIAILEIGIDVVRPRMKFVFHRNAHTPFLCPFPVTYAISNEDTLAAGLIELIEKQFRGEKISPVLVPYVFEKSASLINAS